MGDILSKLEERVKEGLSEVSGELTDFDDLLQQRAVAQVRVRRS